MSRANQSQMDFEYQNHSGPVDPSSPFVQHARRLEHEKENQRPTSSYSMPGTKRISPLHQHTSLHKPNILLGPFSAFNSPSKNSAFSELRPPASSRTWLFDQPPSDVNPAFSTPRPSREVEIPSSGPDDSPDVGFTADSESNTPQDMGLLTRLTKSSNAVKQFIGNSNDNQAATATGSPSPKRSGKGDIVRDTYSNKVVKRVMRKRNKEKDVDRRLALRKTNSSEDSDYDDNSRPSTSHRQDRYPQGPGRIASFFTYIEHHPNLPHIFSYYAQFLLNAFVILGIIYGLYAFWTTIQSDINRRAEEASVDVLRMITHCTKDWTENGCGSERLVRALEAPCAEWRRCMEQDVANVGRSRLSATTFAEIFNSFVEEISWKTLAFTVVILLTFLVGSNGAFWFFRHKMDAGAYQHPVGMPPTPQRYPSGGAYYEPSVQGTPYWAAPQTPGSGYPGWRMESPGRRGEIGGRTPSRRLEWDR